MQAAADIAAMLRATISRDPSLPLVTYYDQATGERTELSGLTLGNWVSKSANFLADDLDVDERSVVALALPPHWHTLALAYAAWSLGAGVGERNHAHDADVLICAEPRMMEFADESVDHLVVSSLDPFGRAVAPRPDHVIDFTSEVRLHGDQFLPRPVAPDAPAVFLGGESLDQQHALNVAHELFEHLGLTSGDRILIDANSAAEAGLLAWAVAPYAAGASIVLVRASDDADSEQWLTRVAEQEKVTRGLAGEV